MARLYSLFHPGKIKPEWEFNPGALIWRIFCTSTNRIIGEARDKAKKSASFFCLDAHSGRTLWKNLTLDESWWIGIEAVQRDVLILHEFARPDMPQHKGLLAVDGESGKLLWKNAAFSYWFSDENIVYGQKNEFEKRAGCALDLRTGTVLSEYADNLEPLLALERSSRENGVRQTALFPEPFDPDGIDPAVADTMVTLMERKTRIQSMEFLLHRGLLLVDFYETIPAAHESPALTNILEIIDSKSGRVLHREAITIGAGAPAPDAFFVKDNYLYFIKNQTTLTAMKLWKS